MVQKELGRKIGRPRKFDENDALDKAMDVFWQLGYDAADTQTLSARTGLSKPSLYNAFGAKEDLFVATLQRYQHTRLQASLTALNDAPTPEAGILNYFLHFAETISRDGDARGCLVMSIAIPVRNRLKKVAEALEDMPKASAAQILDYLTAQIECGNLPADFQSHDALTLMQDLAAAMSVQARAGADLASLQAKAHRNVALVLFAGRSSQI